jgi:hypothetical protein
MLKRLTAIEFNRPTASGKTRPAFITCEDSDGSTMEVVAKFSSGCELGVTSLAMEAIAACLAGDLGLPIPEPVLVEVPADWAQLIHEPTLRTRIQAACPVAFGSKLITGQYAEWTSESDIGDTMIHTAAAIMFFDGAIQNPDRRVENPNCIVRGGEIRIYDHELTFSHGIVIGWQPPWVLGGLKPLETPGFHIFRAKLRGRAIDYEPIRASWSDLSDTRIAEYEQALPPEWGGAQAGVTNATTLIRGIRDNIDDCIAELKRVLT